MSDPRPAPVSFPLLAPMLMQEEAIRLWKATDRTVKRWAAEHGVAFKPRTRGTNKPLPRPDTFTKEAVAGAMSKTLEGRFGVGRKVIRRWLKELGVHRQSVTTPAPRVVHERLHILRQKRVAPSVPKDSVKVAAPRATLPSEPCWRCGARGLCGHGWRVAA